MSDQLIFTEETDRPEKKGGRVIILLILFLLLLAGGGYAWAWSQAKDRIPRGTTIEGVKIGGKTRGAALEALETGLGPQAERPMDVSLASETVPLVPGKAGISVDYEASVDRVGAQRSLNPGWLWDYFTGGDEVAAVVERDDDALDAELERLAESVQREPVEGSITFKGGAAKVTQSKAGVELDLEEARDAVAGAYLTDDVPELTLRAAEPEIGREELATAQRTIADPAVSGPVTLKFGKASVRLTPKQFLPAVSITASDGELGLEIDQKKLVAVVDRFVADDGVPTDAQIVLRNGKPTVIPARTGVTYRTESLMSEFREAITAEGAQRTRKLKGKVAQPDFTTKDARKLGVKERVSTFTTYFPYAQYRNVNLGRAAEKINGTLLKPGETFSLNGIVGERTRANGFTEGYIISDGILVGDLGGGVSQIATTTFNTMFFAGLEDVEHKPHSFYISRYPVGREATVAWGAVDLKFRNTTPYGVLVESKVTPSTPSTSGVVTVSMYSTKYWDITTKTGSRYAITKPEVRRVDSLRCHDNEGYGGFDINIWRYFRRAGSDELVRSEKMHTTYTPSDTVECTNPDAIDPIS